MGQLTANDIAVEHESVKDDSNIVVVNTCGFIDNAKEESINTILEQAKRKANGNIEKLFVTGCLSERYKDDLEKGKQVVRQETFHFTGSKAMEGNMKNDYKVGLWTYYYQDGTKRLEGNYTLGQKDGLWTYYYDNGVIANQYTYKSKTVEGQILEWHINKECWTRSGNPCECGPSWWSDCEEN